MMMMMMMIIWQQNAVSVQFFFSVCSIYFRLYDSSYDDDDDDDRGKRMLFFFAKNKYGSKGQQNGRKKFVEFFLFVDTFNVSQISKFFFSHLFSFELMMMMMMAIITIFLFMIKKFWKSIFNLFWLLLGHFFCKQQILFFKTQMMFKISVHLDFNSL